MASEAPLVASLSLVLVLKTPPLLLLLLLPCLALPAVLL
jgi:hypothetical protein